MNSVTNTKFWTGGAYFETKTPRVTYRVWTNPGKPRKTCATECNVAWSAVVDDFGNLIFV